MNASGVSWPGFAGLHNYLQSSLSQSGLHSNGGISPNLPMTAGQQNDGISPSSTGAAGSGPAPIPVPKISTSEAPGKGYTGAAGAGKTGGI